MIRRRLKVIGSRIDYSAIAAAGGIPKSSAPIAVDKGWKEAAFIDALAKAYEKVNRRDDGRSRVTGRRLMASTGNDRDRREHNHLENRSTAPDRITDPDNIFLVSTYEHRFITSNALLIHGSNARRKLLFYWNPRIFKDGAKVPFRIPAAYRYEGKAAA